MRWFVSLGFLFLALPVDAAFVEMPSGQKIKGTEISASADGDVTLVTATGQKMVFRKGRYRRAVADKPPGLARAEKLLAAGQTDEAVALLEKVKADFRFLSWDRQAIRLLADHYLEAGQFAEAAKEFQSLDNPNAQEREKCRQALIGAGRADAVLPELEKEIASGSREAAARAYLMRGDLRAAGGDAEGARRDWLKVATFFKAQREAAKMAEARMSNSEQGMTNIEGAEK